MPHDPHEQFDHSLLDLIEHNPAAAVPHTPTHQEALQRLYAAHQVYANADQPGGHVTARSLALRPAFQARNLDDLVAGRIAAEALEPNAGIFDRYVQSLPAERRAAAEARRLAVAGRVVHHRPHHGGVVAHDPVHSLFLVPGAGPHPGLPGNYLYGHFYATAGPGGPWAISIHDSEDGRMVRDAASLKEVLDQLPEVIASAPFTLAELEAFGFRRV
jgi:hypothetical protein